MKTSGRRDSLPPPTGLGRLLLPHRTAHTPQPRRTVDAGHIVLVNAQAPAPEERSRKGVPVGGRAVQHISAKGDRVEANCMTKLHVCKHSFQSPAPLAPLHSSRPAQRVIIQRQSVLAGSSMLTHAQWHTPRRQAQPGSAGRAQRQWPRAEGPGRCMGQFGSGRCDHGAEYSAGHPPQLTGTEQPSCGSVAAPQQLLKECRPHRLPRAWPNSSSRHGCSVGGDARGQ